MPTKSNDLLNALANHAPAERGGAIASNRFAFQLSWVLCRILDLHSTNAPYAVLLDYHDDVLELDDESSPSTIDFYQVKSRKKGNWTVNRLIKRSKGKSGEKLSIVGKLASHRSVFKTHVRATTFVSNAAINITLANGNKADSAEQFAVADMAEADKSKIKNAVKAECSIHVDKRIAADTRFSRTPLSWDDHENQSRGRLATFLEKHASPNSPVNPVYKFIRAELSRRNNDEQVAADGLDLAKKKLFPRSLMDQILRLAQPETQIADLTRNIDSTLASESVQFGRRKRLVAGVGTILADRLDASNTLLRTVGVCIQELCLTVFSEEDHKESSLMTIVESINSRLDPGLATSFTDAYSADHLDALIVLTCHEYPSLSSTNSQSSDEAP